ncbi:hypothetical protein EI94DRAFT_1745275 [Lactarius quietus]|nr:hypothetical protein EI94DRAFT_1745275 [Lactarius quietus]
MVKDPLPDLSGPRRVKLLNAWIGLSDRTLASDLLPERVKSRRTVICARTFDPTDFPIRQVLVRIVSEGQYGPVQSAEIARLVRGRGNHEDEETTTNMRALVSSVVARAQRRDDIWFAMASDELSVPESVLRNYATHGDSLSLVLLIHVTRQQFSRFQERYWPIYEFSKVLFAASKFNVLDTSHELQHEFCALWNQIVLKVQEDDDFDMAFYTLGQIRSVYVALHQSTDSAPTHFSASTGDEDDALYEPSSYPLCNIPGHHPDTTPHVHNVSASIAIPCAVLHDDAALVSVSPAGTPDVLFTSVSALHVDDSGNRIDVPLLNNTIPTSFHPTRQTPIERPRILATSSDPATTVGGTRDIETSARRISPTTPVTTTSTSSVSSTGAASLQNTTDILVHSDAPAIPPSASTGAGLDGIPESRCPTSATKSPGTSPQPTSAPKPGTAKGIPKAGSREDKDTPDPPSVNRATQANTVDILDPPLQPPPLPPATDIAIPGRSRRVSDVGKTGGHLPHTSHGQYDIV